MSAIREMRKLRNWTQTDLAKKLGVRQATVSAWESGKSKPSPLALSKISPLMHEEKPCPECFGGHFRPCQVCSDTGLATFLPNA